MIDGPAFLAPFSFCSEVVLPSRRIGGMLQPMIAEAQSEGMQAMKSVDISTIVLSFGIAVYLAIALDNLALDAFKLSNEVIRTAALATAILVAALLAIDFFGKKFRKIR
jgi:hypothetical protein